METTGGDAEPSPRRALHQDGYERVYPGVGEAASFLGYHVAHSVAASGTVLVDQPCFDVGVLVTSGGGVQSGYAVHVHHLPAVIR